ncbi:MAG: PQQ-dependent sugar dehydrogenase [Planctomycetes bacterium]|nr:PQQ-dependent sugar dehydrogenase [Planctomycetota bacterium]
MVESHRTMAHLVAGVALACGASAASAQTLLDPRLRVSVWASGFSSNPTTFTWIGPGEMLVLQKHNGRVRWVKDGVILGDALDLPVNIDQERGGLGIVADPDFATNGFVYIYYSKSTTGGDTNVNASWLDNRVERYTWNGATLGNAFGPLVAFPADPNQGNGPNHDGGVLRFGPDGKLYGQTGDLNRGRFGGKERVEQNTATSGSASVGGIFRINADGTIPPDNPFTGESDAALHLWWSYGLRNGFGMSFDPVTGELWNTENGSSSYDEVCRVPKGMNSGWLKIMGPDARDATYFENGFAAFDASDLVHLANSTYVDPAFSFKVPVGITAIGFLTSKLFPHDLQDRCLFADNNLKNLYAAPLDGARAEFVLPPSLADRVADDATERDLLRLGTNFGVVTDLQLGADGYLYLMDHTGMRVLQVRPVTDELDPAAWRLEPGARTDGASEAAEASDDVAWEVSDGVITRRPRPLRIGAEFALNAANPLALVAQVETRSIGPGVPQQIEAWNVATQRFETVDVAVLGRDDVARTVALDPALHLDPVTRAVKLRLSVLPLPGSRQPPRLAVRIDLLRLDVTYP